jgi:hypothetical protein
MRKTMKKKAMKDVQKSASVNVLISNDEQITLSF